jgi:Fe2+ or Zn2+ uptake regulation protein
MNAEELWSKLSVHGYKVTNKRKQILQSLLESDWMTAKSLFEQLQLRKANIDFSTVCRNLDILYGLGMLCRVDLERNGNFYYCLRDREGHHHHLICRSCGKILPLDFCPLNNINANQTQGFIDLECSFDVYGFCKECSLHD